MGKMLFLIAVTVLFDIFDMLIERAGLGTAEELSGPIVFCSLAGLESWN
jgi:hypothetical protein